MSEDHRASAILMALILLLPAYQIRWTIGGIPITLLELGILLLAVTAIFILPPQHSLKARLQYFFTLEHPLLVIVIAVFICSTTAAAILSPQTIAAAGLWKAYIIEAVLAFYIVRRVSRSIEYPLQRISVASSALLMIMGIVAVIQYIHPSGITIGDHQLFGITDPLWSARSTFRATSVFEYPNALGLLSAPLTVLVGTMITWYGFQAVLALGFVAGLLCISLANSNGAMLAVAIGLCSLCILPRLTTDRRRAVLGIVGILFLIAPFIPSRGLLAPILKTSPSGILRTEQYEETRTLLRAYPLFGGGLGNYPYAIAPVHNTAQSGLPFLYPHNIILALWSEFGFFGLLSTLLLVVLTIRSLLRSVDKRPDAWILLATWLTLIIHGLVDVPYFKNDLAIFFWILMALSWSVPRARSFETQSDRAQILASPTSNHA